MYSIAHPEAPAGEELWAVFAALRLLDEAEEVLTQVAVETGRLAAESTWRNQGSGPRTLRAALDQHHQLVQGEMALVREQSRRIWRGVGA